MPTSYTSLLGLALPVTSELDGTWGDVVNNSITQLVEDSVAGAATASVTSGDWTLTTTGAGAQNQARCAILIPTGTPGVVRNINAPKSSKAYVVINQSDADVVIRGGPTTPTTGVVVPVASTLLVVWTGSDFVQVGRSVGQLRFQDAAGGQYVGLQAPATVPTSYVLTLPPDDGNSGQVLTTDGSGTTTWTTPSSGVTKGQSIAFSLVFGL